MKSQRIWWWLLGASMAAGCAAQHEPASVGWGELANEIAGRAPCAALRPPVVTAITDAPSGAVAVARAWRRSLAFVADEDERAIHTVDVESMSLTSVTPLAGAPAHVLVLGDGRIAVSLKDTSQVAIYEPAADPTRPLELRCAADVADEPIGMAQGHDSIVVVSGWGARLSVLSDADLHVEQSVALPREPRAVVLSDDGAKALVSHMVGSALTVVDLQVAGEPRSIELRVGTRQRRDFVHEGDAGAPRESNQGFALVKTRLVADGPSHVLAPRVSVDPGELDTPVSGGYGAPDGPHAVVPMIARIDATTERSLTRSLAMERSASSVECLLPRAAVADGSDVYLACMGNDSVLVLDARGADPIAFERARLHVGAGPAGLALVKETRQLVVLSSFARELARFDLDAKGMAAVPVRMRLPEHSEPALDRELRRGRELFHTTLDARISRDGRACASCHPDGRDDGLVWTSPDGRRQTKMLAGQLTGSAPYGWFGEHTVLEEHLADTVARLGGTGFGHTSDKPDLRALARYALSLRAPVTRSGSELERVAQGKELFENDVTGCSGCHRDGGTDGSAYDVGSGVKGERRKSFDTPSLQLVAGTAPYFHDGRYTSLRELLIETDGKMGHTGSLAPSDLDALEAYLRTL